MNVSTQLRFIIRLFGIWEGGCFLVLILLTSASSGWSQEDIPHQLLPQQSFESLQKHAERINRASTKFAENLFFSPQDERVLLHLPKRGFPCLAFFLGTRLLGEASSTLFMPEYKLKSCSKEEDIAGELLVEAMTNRVMANRYTCFHLVKELAPSPEAMQLEKQAKELKVKIESKSDAWTEGAFLDTVESVRALFDQMKGLPQMTSEELAREQAESAVLAPGEYLDGSIASRVPDTRTWSEQRIDRQSHWDREGFLVAYSELTGPDDYLRYQMVIKPLGGVFEAAQMPGSSTGHDGPYSYESKLPPADLRILKDYLEKLPPSDASGTGIHFIVSFTKDGSWVTRTYASLPDGNPFQPILSRMIRQARREWVEEPPKRAEFLGPQQ